MFHLAANYGSLDNTANQQISALNDGILSIRNNVHVPPYDLQAVGVLGLGAQLTNVRIANPYLQAITQPYVLPLQKAALPVVNNPIADYRKRPIIYRGSEGIVYQVTNGVAGPTKTTVLTWLKATEQPAPTGQPYAIQGTSTTAAVANTWTPISVTWNFNLPAGIYSVIGGVYYATNAIAFQVTFPNMYYRPGGLGYAADGNVMWEPQWNGGLGEWGQFDTISLPMLSVLNNSTDAAHTFYLNCIRLR